MWFQESGSEVLSGCSPITSLVTPTVLAHLLASVSPSCKICRIVMPQCECQHLPSHVSSGWEPPLWYFICMTIWPMNWSSALLCSSDFLLDLNVFPGDFKTCQFSSLDLNGDVANAIYYSFAQVINTFDCSRHWTEFCGAVTVESVWIWCG